MPPLKFNNPSCVVGVECAVVRKDIYAASYTCMGEFNSIKNDCIDQSIHHTRRCTHTQA